MNTKLTLNIDKKTIENAKVYANDNKISLSQLVENYLNFLTKKDEKDIKVSVLVEGLTGIIPNDDSSKDIKNDYYDYLREKYS